MGHKELDMTGRLNNKSSSRVHFLTTALYFASFPFVEGRETKPQTSKQRNQVNAIWGKGTDFFFLSVPYNPMT